jgi:regulatory protein
MPKILEIKKYPRFKDNFKIVFDNDSTVIIDAETIVKFALKKDLFISDIDFDKVLKHSSANRIMCYALYLISQRSYSKKSLTDKLINKGFLQEDIDKLVTRFIELNYLNDEVYAKSLAEYLKNKSKGTYYIKNELKYHNIDDDIISQILSDIFKDVKPYVQIIDLIKKKYPKFNGKDANETKKVAYFFLRRGFKSEDIAKAFREYKNNITI